MAVYVISRKLLCTAGGGCCGNFNTVMPGNPLPKQVRALAARSAWAVTALALALALKFCLYKRLSNLHLHKVRQLPFAGIWQIDIFSFSTAFYLPSQYFLMLPKKTLIKQKRVRIWGWRLKNWQYLLPFVHFSLSTLHLPPCHLLVFCFELRDFDGPTLFWVQHKSRPKSGLGNWEFRQQRWIHV